MTYRLRACRRLVAALAGAALLGGTGTQAADFSSKPPNAATRAAQAEMLASLPRDDGRDEGFARRGFIATAKDPVIRNAAGDVVWNMAQLDFIDGAAPPSVNPSLWRHMRLLRRHGLFKLADGVWQVRGFDASNMTIIRGKRGWIIVDPLMTTETAGAALALVSDTLGKRPVTAVIYSHSHPDHFGGVRAVVAPGSAPAIIAPEHLVDEAVSEYLLAGNAMSRRVAYQFGLPLAAGPRGYVGGGIVFASARNGTVTLLPPTDSIRETGETRVIDGVKFEFQMVPETEAPAEMNFFLPESRTLYISEFASCTMHNVQTPRGALVRDTKRWAAYLTELAVRYGDRAEQMGGGHCWPRFGRDEVRTFIDLQRDSYKFIHDQTVRRFNRGETQHEIAEALQLPPTVADEWSNRGYYGTVRHNARGVFQYYMGWWNGIPAQFDPYPPVESGKRYVSALGGAEKLMALARDARQAGDERWAAELLNHLVFAEPDNRDARALLADSYEQLGYRAQSAIWRNLYLSGAAELRGAPATHIALASPDLFAAMPTAAFLDLLASRLNPERIGERRMTVVLKAADRGETSLLKLENAVLVGEPGGSTPTPTVTLSGPQRLFAALFLRGVALDQLEARGLNVEGDRAALLALQSAIEAPPPDFAIVLP